MQQIKCASCEFTKFFVNTIEGTSLISCCECGASFIVGVPNPEIETKIEQVQKKPVEKPKAKAQEPEETLEPEEIVEDKVVESKPIARRLTPEEKQAMLLEMEKGDE